MFSGYRASDGVTLSVIRNAKESDDADKIYNGELGGAVKVVTQGDKLDRSGKVVRKRAQILNPGSRSNELVDAVLWTDGRRFGRDLCVITPRHP